jgi:surface antigen
MMMNKPFVSPLAATTTLACLLCLATPAAAGDASFWGTGIGAALGGWAGSNIGRGSGQLAATAGGVVLGGLIGNSIGSSIDRSSYPYATYSYGSPYYYGQSSYYEPTYVAPAAAPPPTVVYLQQPSVVEYRTTSPAVVSGGYVGGYDAPTGDDDSRYCREYTQKIKVDGKIRESYGTACLQPDGTWKIER